MGLSASQARLLSITQRLSDNELHSEILANSKMRLADESIIAKNNYLNALNSTKLQYTGFDGYGNANTVDLTFNSLMAYSEIKNQNILKNANGQVLISDTDAYNYETSANLYEFLNKYGLYDSDDYADQLAAIAEWEQHYQDYLLVHDNWQNVLMPQYYQDLADYEAAQDESVYNMFTNVVGTSDAPLHCYGHALNDGPSGIGCYKHVLAFLLCSDIDIANAESIPNSTEYFPTSLNGIYVGMPVPESWSGSKLYMNFHTEHNDENLLAPVNAALLAATELSGRPKYVCDGDDDLDVDGLRNIIQAAIDEGQTPNPREILMSDYKYDSATNTCGPVKSLRQKAIDILELITNPQIYFADEYNGSSSMPISVYQTLKNILVNFTDGDMRKTLSPPVRPDEPLFTEERPRLPLIKCDDKAKTQWYINLWYAIDGQENPNELRTIYGEDGGFSHYTVEDAEKQTTYDRSGHVLNPAYRVLPDELRSDANWLQHALANGIVTINQVVLDSNKNELVWAGFEYSSTSSFIEVTDDKKVAQAEAEYQTEMKRIETEDSKIDMKIKKLDTEHSALKTEYDSIAQLIGKNIERSYNTFNA